MVKNNSAEDIYEWYLDTIQRCGTYLLKADDETIEYEIFEVFDIGIISFFYIDTLMILFNARLITKDEMDKGLRLRQMMFDLQKNNEWNLKSFRTSPNWKKVLDLVDEINCMHK